MSTLVRAVAAFVLAGVLLSPPAAAWERGKVQRFATLPAGALNPEGIAIQRHSGDVYVTGFNPTGAGAGEIYVFDDDGRFLRTLTVSGSTSALLGIEFHPDTHALLVVDIGAGNVLEVDPRTGAATVFMATSPAAGLNAIAFDRAGNVYVSASFEGRVYRTGPAGGAAQVFAEDALLRPSGFPPFGANGLDFNRDESALFVANTANDTIVRIPVVAGAAGAAAIFTHSINGADGLFLDRHDNVWVCANQADEIVVTDPTGKAIAKLGDFDGVRDGSPVGLLFPASLARRGEWIYITNLSLDLRPVAGAQSVDSQWAAQVTRHTISRIRFRIPREDDD
jgi:DNA-binding beta-propeller fold protein YncE